jgi:deazaflavin-dependent oxidoreductase (nitroreductase family)
VADTSSTARPGTLRFQGLANRVVKALLATPGLARVVGKRLVTIHVVGRKSGKRYDVPVAYTPDGDALLVGTGFTWAKNLRTGEPVDVTHLGRRRPAAVQVFTDEADVVRYYDVICRGNKQFASFNKIGFDAAGNPDQGDLRRAWTAGARVLRLTVT